MARLNEVPAPPAESIEALKRRFIRQNREIARVNSTQSQRIRNLETEISRLVAENISLREQAIAARAEAERWRGANNVNREILEMKERMESKVNELSLLIVEMSQLPERAADKARRRSGIAKSGNSTDQDWQNRQSMREAIATDRELYDGRLPVIQEDKLYPRRTLESADILAIRHEEALQQASESPELGPPPVAHFDVAEPVAFDSSSAVEQPDDDLTQLPPTLEKRRKRRTSSLLQDMPTEPVSEPPVPEEPASRPAQELVLPLLKSGAKRKLDITELDEQEQQHSNENDCFVFQRKQLIWNNPATAKKASRFTRAPGREADTTAETATSSPQKALAAGRKILAPKSTNSPAKRRVQVSEKIGEIEDSQYMGEKQSTNTSPQKSHRPLELPIRDIDLDPPEANDLNGLPPKTPAGLGSDLLSPTSTEPSVRPQHSQEAAVLNSVEDVLNGSIGRGSRRARAAVNYAEPNLRDKMRRPGKELVPAVDGLLKSKEHGSTARSRTSSTDRAASEGLKGPDASDSAIKVKQENMAIVQQERWKDLAMSNPERKEEPASPLRDKERKETRNRERIEAGDERRQSKSKGDRQYGDELEKAVSRLAIFDPPDSSPVDTAKDEAKAVPAATSKRKASTTATSRRHSTHPTSSSSLNSTAGEQTRTSRRSDSTSGQKASLPRPGSAASLRPQSVDNVNDADNKSLKRSQSVSSNLSAPRAITAETTKAEHGAAMRNAVTGDRNDRVANRRRSMMV
ncbi:Shugoshin [Exophiala dermatitidis]